jgi:hypothetical protein
MSQLQKQQLGITGVKSLRKISLDVSGVQTRQAEQL